MTTSNKPDYGYYGELEALFPSIDAVLQITIPEGAEPGDTLTYRVIPAASHWKGNATCLLAPDGTDFINQLHANGGDKKAALAAVKHAKELAKERRAAYLKGQWEDDDDNSGNELAAL